MRFIINYLMSCFCEHEWERIYDVPVESFIHYKMYHEIKYRCKKCGYEKIIKNNLRKIF